MLESSAEDKWINEFQRYGQIKIWTQDGEFILEKDDIFIDTIADEGFSAASGNGLTVGLSLELTREGLIGIMQKKSFDKLLIKEKK